MDALGVQKKVSDSLGLELQVVVSHLSQKGFETKLESPEKAVCTLNHRGISLTPRNFFIQRLFSSWPSSADKHTLQHASSGFQKMVGLNLPLDFAQCYNKKCSFYLDKISLKHRKQECETGGANANSCVPHLETEMQVSRKAVSKAWSPLFTPHASSCSNYYSNIRLWKPRGKTDQI